MLRPRQVTGSSTMPPKPSKAQRHVPGPGSRPRGWEALCRMQLRKLILRFVPCCKHEKHVESATNTLRVQQNGLKVQALAATIFSLGSGTSTAVRRGCSVLPPSCASRVGDLCKVQVYTVNIKQYNISTCGKNCQHTASAFLPKNKPHILPSFQTQS